MSRPVRLRTRVRRKGERLPRFLVVPEKELAGWHLEGTTVVDVEAEGAELGRRSLKRLDDESWFVDLTRAQCEAAGIDTGDRVDVVLRRASEEPPEELVQVLEESPEARACWEGLTDSRRRIVKEHVREARKPGTRLRRARKALLEGE